MNAEGMALAGEALQPLQPMQTLQPLPISIPVEIKPEAIKTEFTPEFKTEFKAEETAHQGGVASGKRPREEGEPVEGEETAKRHRGRVRKAVIDRADPDAIPRLDPKNHICDQLKNALRGRKPDVPPSVAAAEVKCACEAAHHPRELIPPPTHTRAPGGMPIRVIIPNTVQAPEVPGGNHIIYPSDQIFVTKGAKEVFEQKAAGKKICKHYLKWGACDAWDACEYLHVYGKFDEAILGPKGDIWMPTPQKIPNPHNKLCEKWKQNKTRDQGFSCNCSAAHSIDELTPPNTHFLNPPGEEIGVCEAGDNTKMQVIRTAQIFNTEGSASFLRTVREGGRPQRRQHCYHFWKYQKCDAWEECRFIHVLDAKLMPRSNDRQQNFSPPVELPRVSLDERRRTFPLSLLCNRPNCSCSCAHSMEILQEPNTHFRLPPGRSLTIRTKDGNAQYDYSSDQVYCTTGSLAAYEAAGRGERVLRTHCLNYLQHQKCPHWDTCSFAHVSHTRKSAPNQVQPGSQIYIKGTPYGPANQPHAQNAFNIPTPQGNPQGGFQQQNGMAAPWMNQPQSAQQTYNAYGQYHGQGGAAQPGAAGYAGYGMSQPQAYGMDPQQQQQSAYAAQMQQMAQMAQINPNFGQFGGAYGGQQQFGSPKQGAQDKSQLCVNALTNTSCNCSKAHSYPELQEPQDHTILPGGNKLLIGTDQHGDSEYPSHQVFKTRGALEVLSGQRPSLKHCVEYLRHQKCSRWTQCPNAHVWRPPQ